MAKDPAQRPPTATAFVDDLERALQEGDATQVLRQATPTRPTQPVAAAPAAAPTAAARRPRPPAPRTAATAAPDRRHHAALPRPPALGGPRRAAARRPGGGRGRRLRSRRLGRIGAARRRRGPARPGPRAPRPSARARGRAPPRRRRRRPRRPRSARRRPPRAPPATIRSSLNDRGFERIQAQDFAGAVPLLKRSVFSFRAQGRKDETAYAYALFNLGQALNRTRAPGGRDPVPRSSAWRSATSSAAWCARSCERRRRRPGSRRPPATASSGPRRRREGIARCRVAALRRALDRVALRRRSRLREVLGPPRRAAVGVGQTAGVAQAHGARAARRAGGCGRRRATATAPPAARRRRRRTSRASPGGSRRRARAPRRARPCRGGARRP